MNETNVLAQEMGNLQQRKRLVQKVLSPDDPIAGMQVVNNETLSIGGILTVNKKILGTDSFVIDHKVLGNINSSVLKLDGGYSSTTELYEVLI